MSTEWKSITTLTFEEFRGKCAMRFTIIAKKKRCLRKRRFLNFSNFKGDACGYGVNKGSHLLCCAWDCPNWKEYKEKIEK